MIMGLPCLDPTGRSPTEKELLNGRLPPPGHGQRARPRAQCFCESGLLANPLSCSLKGRLLIKHTSQAWVSPCVKTLEGGRCLQSARTSQRGVFVKLGAAVCMTAAQGAPLDDLALEAWTHGLYQREFLAGDHPGALRGHWTESHPRLSVLGLIHAPRGHLIRQACAFTLSLCTPTAC